MSQPSLIWRGYVIPPSSDGWQSSNGVLNIKPTILFGVEDLELTNKPQRHGFRFFGYILVLDIASDANTYGDTPEAALDAARESVLQRLRDKVRLLTAVLR